MTATTPHLDPSPARRLLSALLPLRTPGLEPTSHATPPPIELDLLPPQSSSKPQLRRRTTATSTTTTDFTFPNPDTGTDIDTPWEPPERSASPRLPWPAHVIGEVGGHRSSLDSISSDASWWSTSSSSSSASASASASASRPRSRPPRPTRRTKREAEAEAVWRDFWS